MAGESESKDLLKSSRDNHFSSIPVMQRNELGLMQSLPSKCTFVHAYFLVIFCRLTNALILSFPEAEISLSARKSPVPPQGQGERNKLDTMHSLPDVILIFC